MSMKEALSVNKVKINLNEETKKLNISVDIQGGVTDDKGRIWIKQDGKFDSTEIRLNPKQVMRVKLNAFIVEKSVAETPKFELTSVF